MFLIFVSHGSNLQLLEHNTNCKDLHITLWPFFNDLFGNNLMN